MPENSGNKQGLILPNLFIPGAAKCATTSLHDYLGQHPDIFMSTVKEPHFFSDDAYFLEGLHEYAKLFEGGKGFTIRGESSQCYMIFPNAAARIKECIPDPRFIFIFRNPVDRAYSHYWWIKGVGYENEEFRDAFLSSMHREPDPGVQTRYGYRGMRVELKYYYQFGCYGMWLEQFVQWFGKEKILVISTESLRDRPMDTLNQCTSFLGVKPFETVDTTMSNETIILKNPKLYKMWADIDHARVKGLRRMLPTSVKLFLRKIKLRSTELLGALLETNKKAAALAKEERAWVAEYYRDDVKNLRNLTGKRFAEWNEDFPDYQRGSLASTR